jgi:hypothetical protein
MCENVNGNIGDIGKRPENQEPADVVTPLVHLVKKKGGEK